VSIPPLRKILVVDHARETRSIVGFALGNLNNFQIAACETADDTGCVISYSTYRADHPPSNEDGSIFGRVTEDGQHALCVNPVELAGKVKAE
jgi:hypothetical protein